MRQRQETTKRVRTAHAAGPALAGIAAVLLAAGLAACQGCHSTPHPGQGGAAAPAPEVGRPTLRLYLVSNLAGALEPCGCTKDQLGGITHAAAWINSERAKAPSSLLVSSGPLFFLDPVLKDDRRDQELAKAETLASSMKLLGLTSFAGGLNDWAGGDAELKTLQDTSGAPMLAVGAGDGPLWKRVTLREINGVRVGFVGVSVVPGALNATVPPEQAVAAGVADLKKQGANILVALVSAGRGEAKRIADVVPDLTAIVVGSEKSEGEGNAAAPPPELVGGVVIAETANHLQSMAVLDLFVRDGSYTFADATGLEEAQKRDELTRRIDELHVKIAAWEQDGKIARADLDARRGDLVKLEAERGALDVRPPPLKGSFFRYTVKEIRESLGSDPAAAAQLAAYYKKVNEHNRVALADRLPVPHRGDQPTFVGVEVCSSCHDDARAVWDKTPHAKAYATLSNQDKQFNLDCVGCHVTGYELPGGSTVTRVDRLKDIQCEVCHGPGSKHALDPQRVKVVVAKPQADACLTCHHAPHVESFDAKAKMEEILGPGHGKPG